MPLSYVQDVCFRVIQFLRFTQTKDFKKCCNQPNDSQNFTSPYIRWNHRNADRGHVKFPKHTYLVNLPILCKVLGRKCVVLQFENSSVLPGRAQLRNDYARTNSWGKKQKLAVNDTSKIRKNDWFYLCLHQIDKFWTLSAGDQKRKSSEFAEIYLKKVVKSHHIKWTNFWQVLADWNHCDASSGARAAHFHHLKRHGSAGGAHSLSHCTSSALPWSVALTVNKL